MKLEPKHLVPYLPYKLKLYAGEYFLKNNLDVLLDKIDMTTKTIDATNLEGNWFIDQVKPILHPLSDLKKGFHKDFDEVLFDDNNYVYTDELGIKATPSIELFIGDGCNNTIIFDSVIEIYYLLLKHHFDVFRLIQKGLAIDINTLKK
jgi:hypothetical protein